MVQQCSVWESELLVQILNVVLQISNAVAQGGQARLALDTQVSEGMKRGKGNYDQNHILICTRGDLYTIDDN